MKIEDLRKIESALLRFHPGDPQSARQTAEVFAESMESDYVTKDYLDSALAKLKAEIVWQIIWSIGLMVLVSTIISVGASFLHK